MNIFNFIFLNLIYCSGAGWSNQFSGLHDMSKLFIYFSHYHLQFKKIDDALLTIMSSPAIMNYDKKQVRGGTKKFFLCR